MNLRPSNILKNIEDGVTFVVGSAARGVTRKVGNAAHDVRIEYRARQMAAEARRMAKQVARVNKLTPEEQRDMERDLHDIVARTNELLRDKR